MPSPPRIFSPHRRRMARQRMLRLQTGADAPRYLVEDMVDDVIERLAFLRHAPARALVVGDHSGALAAHLRGHGARVEEREPADGFDEEVPYALGSFDLIASLGTLDTVNDLPGALIHIRQSLAPGGLAIVSFVSSGSLPALRAAMLVADGDRPAPRLHPAVDVRAGGELLQRTGFADPVIDQRPLRVGFRGMDRLVADLRALGLANVLADPGPPLGKGARERARQAFAAAGEEGRTVETFEILTLSGWRR
ncbi:methyltransferase domain-containing protein [Novosphingobium colocasiae]|uniref:methyltransferase domain-containing protein n=1 Tax=Novosphingobium colocasiae TaxID=1256513 RepID=UPI0035B20B72